jgi:hypothetical protein
MKEDVRRFRKIYSNLVEGKTRTPKQIRDEMGISQPTLKRLIEAPIDEEFHIRASILGLIQDFSKKYRDYERLNIEPEPDQDQNREWFEKLKGKEIKIKLDPPHPAYREKPGEKILQEELRPGIVITITIQTQIA